MYAQKISLQREAFCPKNTTYMKPYVNLPLAAVSGKAGSRLTHVWRVFAEDRWVTFQCECILKFKKKSFPCIGTHNCQQKCDAHSPQLPSQERNLSQWASKLLWLDWQLRWPVTRRLGSWQYNKDIRPKPMSTHWGRVTHICVSKPSHYWTLDNGLAPIQCQAMIWSDIHCLINFTLGNKRCNFNRNSNFFYSRKCIWKCHLQNGIYFASASVCSIKSSELSFVQNTHFCCRIIFELQVAQNSALIQPYSVQNFKMI